MPRADLLGSLLLADGDPSIQRLVRRHGKSTLQGCARKFEFEVVVSRSVRGATQRLFRGSIVAVELAHELLLAVDDLITVDCELAWTGGLDLINGVLIVTCPIGYGAY